MYLGNFFCTVQICAFYRPFSEADSSPLALIQRPQRGKMLRALLVIVIGVSSVDSFLSTPEFLFIVRRRQGVNHISRTTPPMRMASATDGEGKVSWWEAPRRVVASDGGMRSRGIYYWLLVSANVPAVCVR